MIVVLYVKLYANKKAATNIIFATALFSSRSGEIRTPDLLTPSQAR